MGDVVIQVLLNVGWDDVVRRVAWVADNGIVMNRILGTDGTVFERESSSPTLRHEWADEGIYSFFRPALVGTLQEAFWLLGNNCSVLDNLSEGPLEAPTYQWKMKDRFK